MFVIGLTGGIATGKSTVSKYIKGLGIPVVDADLIARQVVEPNTLGYRKVVQHFHHPEQDGGGILASDLSIDRAKLGKIIFGNELARKKLNSILHPLIRWKIFYQTVAAYFTLNQVVILDIPLLFESKLDRFVSKSVLIYCPSKVQLERLMLRDGFDIETAQSRIDSQLPIESKVALADFKIDNSGSVEATLAQVDALLKKLRPNFFVNFLQFIIPVGAVSLGIGFLLKLLLQNLNLF